MAIDVTATAPPEAERLPVVEADANRLARRLLIGCLLFELFFVLADAFINYARLTDLGMVRRFFNIAREDGVASWFGATQTFLVGLTALAAAAVLRAAGGARSRRRGWLFIGLFFLYMAMDDGAEFHERIGSAVKELAGGPLGFFPSYTWQVVFGPLFAAAGLFLLVFLWRELDGRAERFTLLAAGGLLAAAVLLDFIEGLDLSHPANVHRWLMEAWSLENYDVRHFSKSLEEFFEMFATTLLWSLLVRRLGRLAPAVTLRFAGAGSAPGAGAPADPGGAV